MANVRSRRWLLSVLSCAALGCATTTGNTYVDAQPFQRDNMPITSTLDVTGNADGVGLKRVDGKKKTADNGAQDQSQPPPAVTSTGQVPSK